ncbi:MAG: hypothetical protein ACK5FZ_08025 [Bacteroidota bacterium]
MLSKSEKQRVHFARVLAQIWTSEEGAARYLLLDEPLTFFGHSLSAAIS